MQKLNNTEKNSDKKGGRRLKGKVTLPSLEALMHVTPGAKGMAIVMPIKPIT